MDEDTQRNRLGTHIETNMCWVPMGTGDIYGLRTHRYGDI